MKHISSKITWSIYWLFLLMLLSGQLGYSQVFQFAYGTAFDNSFTKIIQDSTGFYVLGQDEPTNGATSQAMVTHLDANGIHQWTLSLDFASAWSDAVLTPNGDLMVVGYTLPLDASSVSLAGLVSPSNGGSFTWVKYYDVPGREGFLHVVSNPTPEDPAYPYYIVGFQWDPVGPSIWDDILLINLDESGIINWKRRFPSVADDEFGRDLEVLSNGDLLLSGNLGTQGVLVRLNSSGIFLTGNTPSSSQFSYADADLAGGSGIYCVGGSFPSFSAYLVKYDQDLAPVWEATISGLTSISQVWDEPVSGDFYVTGGGVFNGRNRAIIMRFTEVGNLPSLVWAKYLDHSETSYIGGSTKLLSPDRIAFVDGRIPSSGGLGQADAFLSVSDLQLTTCITTEDDVDIQPLSILYDGPIVPDSETDDIPIGFDLAGLAKTWQQINGCTNSPCDADFIVAQIDDCGHYTITNTSTGILPLTYQWCNGSSMADLDVTLPCGQHTFCLTITDATGCTSSATQTITVADNIPPEAVCVAPFSVMLDASCKATITAGQIDGGSTDNCQIQSISISPTVITGCGIYQVLLTVTDWCGNTSTGTTIVSGFEDIPPVIQCPPDMTVTAPIPAPCMMQVNGLSLLTGMDNCSFPFVDYEITGATSAFGQYDASGHFFNPGVSTITYKVTDQCGNTSECSFTVDVRCSPNTGGITVIKYNDLDCDGVRDFDLGGAPIDKGLPGWHFALVNTSSGQTYNGNTNAQGQYIFQFLPAGTYTLTETQQQGWVPSNLQSGTMTVTVGFSNVAVEFGNCSVCMPSADPFICDEPVDVLFVLDNSGSIDQYEFDIMKNWVINAVGHIESAYSNAQYGIVHYSGPCGEQLYREHDFKSAGLLNPILRRFLPGTNDDLNVALGNVLKALNHVSNPNLLPTPITYLNQRPGSNLLIIIYTDASTGISHNNYCSASTLLPYTNSILLKQTKNAKITVVYLEPQNGGNSICAAIASPGGTYTGPVGVNGYDDPSITHIAGPRQFLPWNQNTNFPNIVPLLPPCDSVPKDCCDSLMVMSTLTTTGGKCCATLDLKNKVSFPITTFEAEVISSPGWVFNLSSLAHASGFQWESPPTGQKIALNHFSGKLPLGTTSMALSYCLAPTISSPPASQTIVFRWYGVFPGDSIRRVICTDTLTTTCQPTVGEDCVLLVDSTLTCNPDNPYEYIFNFAIQNLSGQPMSQVVLQNLSPGFGFSLCNTSVPVISMGVALSPNPLPNGGISSNLCVKIISPHPVLSPELLCFRLGLANDTLDCNSTDSICMLLKPCCEPCDMVEATIENVSTEDTCCYKIDLHRTCRYELFTKVETEILTPGVIFSAHTFGGPDAANWFMYPGETSTAISYGSLTGAIQQDLVDDIIQFCLDSITNTNQIPQKIVVRWYTSTSSGVEVLCTDTVYTNASVNCDAGCSDGIYSDLFFSWDQGSHRQAVICGNDPISLGCPTSGNGFSFTGKFQCCVGDPHENIPPIKWTLSGPGGSTSDTTNAIPYFDINLLPSYFDQAGLYSLTLTYQSVEQTCSCTLQFNVDCSNLCPCTPQDIQEFAARVEGGFSHLYPLNSCEVCFSPIALNDCETVEWYLTSTDTPPIGTSVGRQTFCYSFPDDNTYDVIMSVTKKKDDGSHCDKQKRTQTISPCQVPLDCVNSIVDNPTFSEGAVAGGLNSGGNSNGWSAISGDPEVIEGDPVSLDGWTIELSGNLDTADVLSRMEPICLDKGTGSLNVSCKSSLAEVMKRVFPGTLKFYLGSKETFIFKLNECEGIDCYELGSVVLPALDSGEWIELKIPYDLTNWEAFDSCGGVIVRPYVFVTNVLSNDQGGSETYSYAQLDNFCFNGNLVAIEEPDQNHSINIFPNPTSGELIIQFRDITPQQGVVQIIDLYGRQMLKENLMSGQQTHSLSIASMPSGIYFVKVLENGQPIRIEKAIKE